MVPLHNVCQPGECSVLYTPRVGGRSVNGSIRAFCRTPHCNI
ncbi:hypothetical protein ACFOGG_17345 [Brenneria rubrifaciens]